MANVLILLGGNIGDVKNTFAKCHKELESKGYQILKSSDLYKSDAWGYKSKSAFLNQALEIKTNILPHHILRDFKDLEQQLGRTTNGNGYEDRVLDIDILFIDDLIINQPDLQVPHPRLHKRNFCLVPLNEIAPDKIHPGFGETVTVLLDKSSDPSIVNPA